MSAYSLKDVRFNPPNTCLLKNDISRSGLWSHGNRLMKGQVADSSVHGRCKKLSKVDSLGSKWKSIGVAEWSKMPLLDLSFTGHLGNYQ